MGGEQLGHRFGMGMIQEQARLGQHREPGARQAGEGAFHIRQGQGTTFQHQPGSAPAY